MDLTITLSDELVEQLRKQGVSDADALNRYAVAAISAYLEGDTWTSEVVTMPISEADRQALDEGFADLDAGRIRPARQALADLASRHRPESSLA